MKSVRAEGARGVSGQEGGGHGRSPLLSNRSAEADPTKATRDGAGTVPRALAPSILTGVLRGGRSRGATGGGGFLILLGKSGADSLEL